MDAIETVEMCPTFVVHGLEWIQTASDLVGMLAISAAFFVAVVRWALVEIKAIGGDSAARPEGIKRLRIGLGNYILLGLEFMIVSDIVHSFLKPDLMSLAELGVIVVIRTAIAYFLGKEIEAVRTEPA